MNVITDESWDLVGGGSTNGSNVVLFSMTSGCLAGGAIGSVAFLGVGTAAGCVAGAAVAGVHSLLLWNAFN